MILTFKIKLEQQKLCELVEQ